MKRMSKRLQRFLSICVIVSLLCCTFINDIYANEFVVTDSNAVQFTEIDTHGYVATGPASEIDYSGEDFPMPYIAIVDDAFVALCAVIFAACGVVASGDNLRSLAMDFYDWLSYHADQYATAWKAAVTAGTLGVGAAIKGIGSLIKAAKAYFLTIKGYGTSAKTYALPAVGSAPQYYYPTPSMLKSWNDGSKYSFSYRTPIDKYGRFTISDYFFPYTPLFGVGSGSSVSLYCISHNSNGIPFPYSIDRYHIASTEYFKGYGKTTFSTPTYGSIPRDIFVDCLKLPIFSTETTLAYYLETGSLMHPEDLLYNPTGLSVSVRPIVDAQTKTADVSDDTEVVIPSIDAIVAALSDVIDADDIADRLARTITDFAWSKVPDIVIPPDPDSPIISNQAKLAYSNLTYIVSVISTYCGVSISKNLIDNFIKDFYTGYISGTSALVEEQSEAILNRFVVINGGANKPDDDGDNNKYKVLKTFAVALGAFLLSAGLVSDSIDFDNEPLVSNNLQIVDSFDDSGKEPSGNIDLSGIVGYLKSILDVLNNWINPLNLMDSLVSKFNLSNIQNNIVKAIKELPLQIANVLDLPNLFDNVINLLPDKLVNGFALPALFNNLFSVIGSLPESIARLFGMSTNFSLVDLCNDLGQKLLSLPDSIAERIKDIGNSEPPNDDIIDGDADNGFKNFLNLFMLAILILVLLIILFINCLRFIILVFNIPVSTSILNADLLSGINYLKSLQLPIFGMSLYSFLLACAYFLIFMSIVTVLRKKIDKIHI